MLAWIRLEEPYDSGLPPLEHAVVVQSAVSTWVQPPPYRGDLRCIVELKSEGYTRTLLSLLRSLRRSTLWLKQSFLVVLPLRFLSRVPTSPL